MGEILRQGIDAYRQTMKPSGKTPENEQKAAPPGKTGEKPPANNNTGSLIKTSLTPSEQTVPAQPTESKTRKVAKFLILIGSDKASRILGELDSRQVEEISREIASIKGVDGEEANAIIAEFQPLLSGVYRYSGPSFGGVETARLMLRTAFGDEKGEALLQKTILSLPQNIFGFLEEFTPEQIVFLLKDESPVTAALILARLSPEVSAKALAKFPPALKPEILKKIARQSEVMPEVLEQVAGAMRERARHLGSGGKDDIEIDGMQALTAILKQGDYSFGDRIINELQTDSPEISKKLKDRLYTLDDVLDAFDKPLAEKLGTMTEQDIAILLKGRSAEFCEKILSNVSSRRRSLIREEGDIIGPVSKRESIEAADDFLAWFRLARANGELALKSDEDWVV
jgi:flagellar motor switch protein FliG